MRSTATLAKKIEIVSTKVEKEKKRRSSIGANSGRTGAGSPAVSSRGRPLQRSPRAQAAAEAAAAAQDLGGLGAQVARPRWAEREAEDGTEAVEAAEEAEGDEAVEAEGDEAAADTPLVLPPAQEAPHSLCSD